MNSLFCKFDSNGLAELVRSAERYVCYAGPGIQLPVARAMAEIVERIGPELVTVVLDFDEGVMRMGFGEIEAVGLIQDVGIEIRDAAGLRTALILVDDVGFINALIDTLNENFSIDPERIYACGFSNGGFMSHKLACQLSHRIAAIASVGGIISAGTVEKCNSQRAMPVLQIHGTLDNTVPINGTSGWYSVDETMSFWSELNGCVKVDTIQVPDIVLSDGCTIQKIIYSNSNRKIKAIYYKVEKGGHSWPSATADYSWSGNRNLDINASVEIWNLLKNYTRVQ